MISVDFGMSQLVFARRIGSLILSLIFVVGAPMTWAHEDGMSSQAPPLAHPHKTTATASTILQGCKRDAHCVMQQLTSEATQTSREHVVGILGEIIRIWAQQEFYCHPNAHHLGHFLFTLFEGDVNQALVHTDNTCGNGLYHGVLEHSLLVQMKKENRKTEELDITTTCAKVGQSPQSNKRMQCFHGMGHALAKVYNHDIFQAAPRCEQFNNWHEQDMCLDGVFMENHVEIFNGGTGVHSKDDLYYPCNAVAEKFQYRCYVYQAYYLLRANNYEYAPAFKACEHIPAGTDHLIGTCIGGVVNYLTVRKFFNDIDGMATMCAAVNPEYQKKCTNLVVFALVRYVDPKLGDDFCQLLPPDQTQPCLQEWQRVQVSSNLQ